MKGKRLLAAVLIAATVTSYLPVSYTTTVQAASQKDIQPEASDTDTGDIAPLTGYIEPTGKEVSGNVLRFRSERVLSSDSSESLTDWSKYSSTYFYDRMTDAEKKLYAGLSQSAADAMESYDEITEISAPYSGLTSDQRRDVVRIWLETEAQYYFVYGYYRWSGHGNDGTLSIDVMDEYQKGADRRRATHQFRNTIDSILTQAQAGRTIVDKEKIVHDALAKRLTWDDSNNSSSLKQTSSSSLIGDNTVCAGYAAAFSVLMNALGADTISISGSKHEWNEILLGGKWYNVDVTWDDPLRNGNNNFPDGSNITYRYFNVSDATLEKWKSDSHIPYDYWDTNGRPVCSYDGGTSLNAPDPAVRSALDIPSVQITYGDTVDDSLFTGAVATADGQNISGTFSYDGNSQEIPDAGSYTIPVKFTPSDTSRYLSVTGYTDLTVLKRPLTVTFEDMTIDEGDAAPDSFDDLDYSVTGTMAGDDSLSDALTISCGTVPNPSAGTYTITAKVAASYQKNYDFTINNATLTVRRIKIDNGTLYESPSVTMLRDQETALANPGVTVYSTALYDGTFYVLSTVTDEFGTAVTGVRYSDAEDDIYCNAYVFENDALMLNGRIWVHSFDRGITDTARSLLGSDYYMLNFISTTSDGKTASVAIDSYDLQADSKGLTVFSTGKTYTMTDISYSDMFDEGIDVKPGSYVVEDADNTADINAYIISQVKAKQKSVTLKKGKSKTLSIRKNASVKKVTWSSSNKKIATVSKNGKVKARKKKGTAVIRARVKFINGASKTISIRVKVK